MDEKKPASFYHEFIDDHLGRIGFCIKTVSREYMKENISKVMDFVNSIRIEHSDAYGWRPETEAYFLDPLQRKFDFSFVIEKIADGQIGFTNFSSLYGDILHNHCTYASHHFRGMNFAKFHLVKLCQTALDEGIKNQEGYWPKHNNGSIILFLKMGWKIEEIRKNGTQLFMRADNLTIRDNAYGLLMKK